MQKLPNLSDSKKNPWEKKILEPLTLTKEVGILSYKRVSSSLPIPQVMMWIPKWWPRRENSGKILRKENKQTNQGSSKNNHHNNKEEEEESTGIHVRLLFTGVLSVTANKGKQLKDPSKGLEKLKYS